MRNKTIIALILVVLLLGFNSESFAQRYSVILEKLNSLESKINELEAARKGDLVMMNRKLAQLSPESNSAELEGSLEDLKLRVKDLATGLQQLESGAKSATANIEAERLAVDNLAGDLRGLVSELRQTIEASPEHSIDDAPMSELEEILPGLEISGFADFRYAAKDDPEAGDEYEFGQVEVDLATVFEEKIAMEVAIAFVPDEGFFELGSFIVDFHLFGSEGDHFRPVDGIDHSGVIAGQFDVPFGIDWHEYTSIDRRLVSAPIVVEHTHEEWNDYGVQGYMEAPRFNAVVYATNGFDYNEVEMKAALGGRLGIRLTEHTEVGGSYATFFDQDDRQDMSLAGIDFHFSHESFSINGEYITHSLGLAGDESLTNSGFYGQGMYEFGKYFVTARYGAFSPEEEGAHELTRTALGVGYLILEGSELRLEYQVNSGGEGNVTFLQLAIGF